MADEQESDKRVVRSSALVLFLTGVALMGCVALAVGVTVQLVELPRPRVSAGLTAVSDTSKVATDDQGDTARSEPTGTGPVADLALVGAAASSASELANQEAAKLAAKQARAQRAADQASRSRARQQAPDDAADTADPADPTSYEHRFHRHHRHPYPQQP